MLRQGLGLWLAVAVAIATAAGVGQASGARWDVTLHVAPAAIELAATTDHVRVSLHL
jgi:hypothetical protein